jgi:hypothetical protein
MGIGLTDTHTSILERLWDGWQLIINYSDIHKIYLLAFTILCTILTAIQETKSSAIHQRLYCCVACRVQCQVQYRRQCLVHYTIPCHISVKVRLLRILLYPISAHTGPSHTIQLQWHLTSINWLQIQLQIKPFQSMVPMNPYVIDRL